MVCKHCGRLGMFSEIMDDVYCRRCVMGLSRDMVDQVEPTELKGFLDDLANETVLSDDEGDWDL